MTAYEPLPKMMALMERLLSKEGCPWDRAQTFRSLRPFVLEEAHEVVAAIDSGDPMELRDELGDLLFQVVFLASLAKQQGSFTIRDVVDTLHAKMVRRHPWVFGDDSVESKHAVSTKWEAMKAKERGAVGRLSGVPVALPALLRAFRVGHKAAAVGYDWPDATGPRAKIDEELAELDDAIKQGEGVSEELGDVLFAVANLARKLDVDPESALRECLNRFSSRFSHVEKAAQAQNLELSALSDAERDALWEAAKLAVLEG